MLNQFLADKSLAHRIMLGAVLLLLFSQFLPYFDDAGSGIPSIDADFNTTGYYWLGSYGTGWQLHPQAYVILVFLGFAFLRDDIYAQPWFARFGWWGTVILFVAATSPGAPLRASGAGLGGIAVLLALLAALMHWMELRKTSLR